MQCSLCGRDLAAPRPPDTQEDRVVPLATPRRSSSAVPVVLAGVVVLLVGAVAFLLLHRPGTSATASTGSSLSPVQPSRRPTADPVVPTYVPQYVPTEPPSPSVDPERAALEELIATNAADLRRTPIAGQVVVQLSSKRDGTVDPQLQAANGTHTFHNSDILAEFQQTRARVSGNGVDVVLLRSSDYDSGHNVQGQPYWVTFALGQFGSTAQAQQWCQLRFVSLSGAALKDVCWPNTLDPR